MITRAGAFQASSTFADVNILRVLGLEADFAKFVGGNFLCALAVWANDTDQALRHNAIECGNEVVRLDTHVDEAADDVRDVVGVNGCENKVPGESGLNSNLRGFLIADFADHDLVRIVTQDRAQPAGESKALLFVDRDLRDTAKLILHGIFNGDDLVFVGLDFVYGRVKRGGLAGTRGTSNEHHAVRFADVAAEASHFFLRKANDVKTQALEFFGQSFLVEDAELGNIQVTQHLNAGDDGRMPVF